MKLKADPNAKLRLWKALSSTIGSFAVSARQKKTIAPTTARTASSRDRLIVEPIVARAFLEHVFERAEEQRHRRQVRRSRSGFEKRVIRLVEIDEEKDRDRDRRCRARR